MFHWNIFNSSISNTYPMKNYFPHRGQPAWQKRRMWLYEAREKGTHTKQEWQDMILFFDNKCAKCHCSPKRLCKDHVIPLYFADSTDSIQNIQPLCDRCNSVKGKKVMDFRASAAAIMGKELPEHYKLESECQSD
jgi:5-methylcytosine-specific restriction endonuclease McrA